MSDWQLYAMMALGVFFIILGLVFILAGRKEKGAYYNAMVHKPDLREYFEHNPERPELTALQIGGYIFDAVGLVLVCLGAALKFFGPGS